MPENPQIPSLDLALHSEKEIDELEILKIQEERKKVTEVIFDTTTKEVRTYEYKNNSGDNQSTYNRTTLNLGKLKTDEDPVTDIPKSSAETEGKHIYRITDTGKKWCNDHNLFTHLTQSEYQSLQELGGTNDSTLCAKLINRSW